MSRFGRVGRRPDHWASSHERARSQAAERLDAPLSETDDAWLDRHLAECPSCLTTAQAYEADRVALRSMRDLTPEPPRDLWARTSAGIEQEAAGRRRAERGSSRRPVIAQFGAIAGIAVVAMVVGSSVLTGAWLDQPIGATNGPDGSDTAVVTPGATDIVVVPGATPLAVDAGAVGWFDVGADGSYAYNVAHVDEVCAELDQASCAAVANGSGRRVALSTAPKSIITSPSSDQAVVVGDDDSITIVALPGTGDPTASPDPTPATTPSPTPAATATPTSTAATTPPASSEPTLEPTATATVEPTLTASPTAAALAIISGVTVVGDAAAFSPDGVWFAFTARPADGSAGPDIYAWRVGDAQATAVTSDHSSEFGSWADGRIVGSRPGQPEPVDASLDPNASPEPTATAPVLISIDPSTGVETILARSAWRSAVDPTGALAVSWDGLVTSPVEGSTVTLTDGRLVLDAWDDGATAIDPDAYSITDGPVGDFTVRWDETGTWLAVWVAGVSDPTAGRLSLLHVDPATGEVIVPKAGPQDVLALPGFSIENGRLAWATPPSQDGEGSRVQIVAWTADGVGSVESAPGTDVVVVR